jgi:hypothetical protein
MPDRTQTLSVDREVVAHLLRIFSGEIDLVQWDGDRPLVQIVGLPTAPTKAAA